MGKGLLGLLVVLIAYQLYNPTKKFDFVWDDQAHISEHFSPTLSKKKLLQTTWKKKPDQAFTPVAGSAVAMQSAVLFKRNQTRIIESGKSWEATLTPGGFHLSNIALHCVNSFLVFLLISSLVRHPVASFLGATLFAIHPLQVEAVAWISSFQLVLGTFFILYSLWLYLNYSRHFENNSKGKRHIFSLALSFGSYLLALLTTPFAVVTPILAFAFERMLPKKKRGFPQKKPMWIITLWALIALPVGISWVLAQNTSSINDFVSIWSRPLIAADAFSFYIQKFILPLGLSPDYGRSPLNLFQSYWGYFTWIIPAAMFVGIILFYNNKKPWSLILFSLLFTTLFPVLGILSFEAQEVSAVADRYAYLAMLIVGLGVAHFLGESKKAGLWATTVAVIAWFGFLTHQNIDHWQNNKVLWKHVLTVNPESVAANTQIAKKHIENNQLDEAEPYLQRVIDQKPSDKDSLFYLSQIKKMKGQKEIAVSLLKTLIKYHPNYPKSHGNLAFILDELGRTEEAIPEYAAELELDQNNGLIMYSLGRALEISGRHEEAVQYIGQALKSQDLTDNQKLAEAHFYLASALESLGQRDLELVQLEKSVELDPTNQQAQLKIARHYYSEKLYPLAISHYSKCLDLVKNSYQDSLFLARAYLDRKDAPSALSHIENATALKEDSPEAFETLGITQFKLKSMRSAKESFAKALHLNKKLADANFYLGEIKRWSGKNSEALSFFYRSIEINPIHVMSNLRIGIYFSKQGMYSQALKYFKRALTADPENKRVLANIRNAETMRRAQ